MSLTYTTRLICLCCASFFVIHLALSLVVRLAAATSVRLAEHLKPSRAARFLFGMRLAPLVLTFSVVVAFCIPSYLWLEPATASGEKVGWSCLALAALAVVLWTFSLCRVMSAIRGTNRYLHDCERHGRKIAVPGEHSAALLLADKTATVAVAGIFRPRLLISRRVMHELSPEQREAALRHERAHLRAGDNLKRLLMLLAPDAFPCVPGFGQLERAWAKFTEWAADDQATDGDAERALTLASALVRVAKMRSKPQASYLSCSLVGDTHELSERVDRLLRPHPAPAKPVKELTSLLTGAGALMAIATGIVLLWPGSLAVVHQALEGLIH